MPEFDFRAPRLFVDAPLHEGQTVALERGQSNYLGNVLRLGAGDTILVFNGQDGEWRTAIAGRSHGSQVSARASSTQASTVVISAAPERAVAARISLRRRQRSGAPTPMLAAMAGASATV